MDKIEAFDLMLAMTGIDVDGKQQAVENAKKMLAEKPDYKYDESKTLSENIVAALPQYNLEGFAQRCDATYRTFKNLGSDFSRKSEVEDFKLQCELYLRSFRIPEKINPADKENPYRETVSMTLPEMVSLMTGKVIQDVFYRRAYDKAADMLSLAGKSGGVNRKNIADLFPEYPLEKFAQEFERSVEVAKMMGLDERKGFTVEAVQTLAKGYDFPEKFVIEEKLPEKTTTNAIDHAREMVKAKMQQGTTGISKKELTDYKQMKGKSKDVAQKESDALFNRIGNPRDL